MNTVEIPGTTRTLRERLDEGPFPVQEGLRYTALLAEALREMHDRGKAHGALTPAAIAITDRGIDLLPAPYGAPVLAGEGKRSDVCSFGAVVFEMLTGRTVVGAPPEISATRIQLSLDSLAERVAFLEQNHIRSSEPLMRLEVGFENLREQVRELHAHVAADIREFELNLKAQSNVIESARTAQVQTDDLVERVVEALELLQSRVLEGRASQDLSNRDKPTST